MAVVPWGFTAPKENPMVPRAGLALLAPLLLLSALACGGGGGTTRAASASFGVLSDTHLLDAAALGASGPDFQAYLAQDRKMLAQSEELLDAALVDLTGRKLDFVLVTGDLTKDGEKVDHELMAQKLAQLRAAGTPAFVIPGNHDINNPDAVSYLTLPPSAVAQVTPAEFKAIYSECGYGSALYQDPASLSYIAEPVAGLWLFALDSAKYADNAALGVPVTSGALSPATQAWVLAHLQLASQQGKSVVGMMHHGIVEHFAGEAAFFPEYVLDDFATVGRSLADAGLHLVFTGHFHANDIAMKDFGTSKLYDCETGSTVTAPSPYRIVKADLAAQAYAVTTAHVTSIPSFPAAADFATFSTGFLQQGLYSLEMAQLQAAPYSLDAATAGVLAPMITAGMMAHYAGDETLTDAATQAALAGMLQSPSATTRQVGQFIGSLWTDLGPADNSATLALK